MRLLTDVDYADLLAVRNMNLTGRVVRWWTSSHVDHIACCIGKDFVCDSVPSRGVSVHPIGFPRAKVYHLKLRPAWRELVTDHARSAGDAFLKKQIGKKYDMAGIIGFATWAQQDPKKWFCSELCAAWLASMGICAIERTKTASTTPQTLFCSPAFDCEQIQ